MAESLVGVNLFPHRSYSSQYGSPVGSKSHLVYQNNVTYGGMICKFNLDGQLNLAYCYTKLIDGRVIDEFYMQSNFTEPDQVRFICNLFNGLSSPVLFTLDRILCPYYQGVPSCSS